MLPNILQCQFGKLAKALNAPYRRAADVYIRHREGIRLCSTVSSFASASFFFILLRAYWDSFVKGQNELYLPELFLL